MIEDFEKNWLAKFSHSLESVVGEEMRNTIMKGSQELSDVSDRRDIIEWSRRAMERLDEFVDKNKRIEIMTGCACEYPKSELQEIRKTYEETKDIDLVHYMLQEKFVFFLKNGLKLDNDMIGEILNRGWGLAGMKQGNKIIATKIPKSGYLLEYMKETDPTKKRTLYCHCPRIRDAMKTDIAISPTYCYCGAGFYKSIWEEILQKPVSVEVLETVIKGDDVCKIAISLPS